MIDDWASGAVSSPYRLRMYREIERIQRRGNIDNLRITADTAETAITRCMGLHYMIRDSVGYIMNATTGPINIFDDPRRRLERLQEFFSAQSRAVWTFGVGGFRPGSGQEKALSVSSLRQTEAWSARQLQDSTGAV